jgi:hypothetical protein
MATSFKPAVNTEWLEAIDTGTGRLYFVRLEHSENGESVRPQGETSWTPPDGFLVRQQLVTALSNALASGGGKPAEDNEAMFLAKVRQRFPPPSTPPPANADTAELKARIAQLEEELQAARAAPPKLADAQRPSWKRGASAKFADPSALGTVVEQPPPPPAWALSKGNSRSGVAPPPPPRQTTSSMKLGDSVAAAL